MLMIPDSTLKPYENHFYANRTTYEQTGNKEFEKAVNGPNCETGDGLGEWHFLKTSVLEKPKPYQPREF